MRIVREQMLCIVSPGWPGGLAPLQAVAPRLDQLLRDVGVVHFASIALLPPGPAGGQPSLMLELAVDEGIRPRDLLALLAYHRDGALWSIYGCLLTQEVPPSVGARNQWLLERLLADLSVADGGFVGPRDRPLAQVRQEGELCRAVRAAVPGLPAEVRAERAPFAAALVRSVRASNRFDWAEKPAARSFWRTRGGFAKTLYLGLIVGLGLIAWLLLLRLIQALDIFLAGTPGIASWFGIAVSWMVDSSWRLVRLLAGLIAGLSLCWLVGWLGALLFGRLTGQSERWSDALERELNRPTDARSARLAHLFGRLTLVVLLVEGVFALAYLLCGARATSAAWLWQARPLWLDWLVQGYAAVYLALLLVLLVALRSPSDSMPDPADGWLIGNLKRFRRWLHRPADEDTPRAQQVDPAIERCEADLVGKTAHMVSLTDLRRPYGWSAFWTRRSLRVVTALGYAFFTEGKLGDAPGIQFSHWHIIDKGRRLLFCANFDGTFGGYLDDFIKGPSVGTTLFWRWSELLQRPGAVPGHPAVAHKLDFAPTRLLVLRGVRCELRFKRYARASMLPHVYRFDALNLTSAQKDRDTALRNALCGQRTDTKDDCIMRAIES